LIRLRLGSKQRILRAPVRSPETLFEELDALNVVMELKRKLKDEQH
jgi:hypothetical protein